MKRGGCVLILGSISLVLVLPGKGEGQRASQGYIPQLFTGQRALREHKWKSAASAFRNALLWNKDGVEAHIGLGDVFLHIGQAKRAEEEYQAALKLDPDSAAAERGIDAARTPGEAEEAFTMLLEQVKREPNNADAHSTLAEELIERNRLEEAKSEAETALRLDPKAGHPYCVLGRIAMKQGHDDEARKYCGIALRRDNTDDDALSTLGDLAMNKRAYKQAVTYYRRLVTLLPDETEVHKKLLTALSALKDTKGMRKEQEAIERLSGKL